jgi:hypothetical protein
LVLLRLNDKLISGSSEVLEYSTCQLSLSRGTTGQAGSVTKRIKSVGTLRKDTEVNLLDQSVNCMQLSLFISTQRGICF